MKEMELKQVLKEEYTMHPEAEAIDMLKLIYQNEFGCEHLLSTEEGPRLYLEKEWNSIDSKDEPLVQNIGNGNIRLNLASAKKSRLPIEVVFELFLRSAKNPMGSGFGKSTKGRKEGFREKVTLFAKWCAQGEFCYKAEDITKAYTLWERAGEGPFSHSDTYRRLYKPAYRVLHRTLGNEDKPFIIGIDGRCGSGKSTLAANLSEIFEAPVIHMDDFFLPIELRTNTRFEQVGGNVHFERFLDQVVVPILEAKPISYQVFDCGIMDYNGVVHIDVNRDNPWEDEKCCSNILIIEGAYAFHPRFEEADDIYDMRIFCDISPELQKKRILARNGEDMYKNFRDRWIPLEETYFKAVFADSQEHFLQVVATE